MNPILLAFVIHLMYYIKFDLGKFEASHLFNDKEAEFSYSSIGNMRNFQTVSLFE